MYTLDPDVPTSITSSFSSDLVKFETDEANTVTKLCSSGSPDIFTLYKDFPDLWIR
jgi:hypothetical protein